MNTILKTLSLILAAAIPVAFSAESNGFDLPVAFNTGHLFGAFVVALTLLTLFSDYRSAKPLRLYRSAATAAPANTTAARSVLRLAA